MRPLCASCKVSCFLALVVVSTACTVTNTVTDFLSSTTPGDWYQDGLIKEEYKALVFTKLNFENLKQDTAAGRGEYLASLSELLGVPESLQEEFFSIAQGRAQDLLQFEQLRPEDFLTALMQDLPTDGIID